MALRDYRAAIVDLDGTLVDTLGDFEVALNRTLAELALPPVTRALVEGTVGKGSEHLIRSVLAHQLTLPEVTGLANVCERRSVDTLYDEAWALYQQHYRAINGAHAQVYPGAAEGLQALQAAGLALACLTNKPLAFARELLKGSEPVRALLAKDPMRCFITTDHPNGGSFLAYPQIIRLLMDRTYRQDILKECHPLVRERSQLGDLNREYTLNEIAIITRAGPARICGSTACRSRCGSSARKSMCRCCRSSASR